MWVLDPPGGYPGKTRFLGRPWAKVAGRDPEYVVFWASGSASLPEDRGQATGCDPMGVVEGPCGVPLHGVGGILGKLVF